MEQKTYEGYGMFRMMDVCKKHNLNTNNSDLYIKDGNNLESYWKIVTKGSKKCRLNY